MEVEHEQDGVEDDQEEDEVLKRLRGHHAPAVVPGRRKKAICCIHIFFGESGHRFGSKLDAFFASWKWS